MNTTQTTKAPREIWTTATKQGVRYFYFSRRAMRAFPLAADRAKLEIATGAAVLIANPAR